MEKIKINAAGGWILIAVGLMKSNELIVRSSVSRTVSQLRGVCVCVYA